MGPGLCLNTVLRWAARLPQTDELRAAIQEVHAWDRRTQYERRTWMYGGGDHSEEQFEASKRALAALIRAARRAD